MLLAVGHITNRDILIGDVFHYDADPIYKTKPEPVWSILDKDALKKEFPVLEPNVYTSGATGIQHDFNVCFFDSSFITQEDDFSLFSANRTSLIDCNREENNISLNGPIGSFCYNVYSGTKEERNILKKKINKALLYQQKYVDIAEQLIKSKCDNFNAVHFRYPFFRDEVDANPQKLLEQLILLFDKDVPLYIATDFVYTNIQYGRTMDIEDYIGPLRKHFKQIILLSDFNLNLTYSEEIAIDQLICVMSSKFYGTYYSTFSKRINILRGIQGKQAQDYMGWNEIQEPWQEIKSPFPWNNFNGQWPWHYSSYLQYTYE